MKLIVTGHAGHGKDSVSHMLCALYGYTFSTSSHFATPHVVRPYLEKRCGLFYKNDFDCYKDRQNHREAWFKAIYEYNRDDPARLARELFNRYNIYCGIRSQIEFDAVKPLIDDSFWVDATYRKNNVESFDSMKLVQASMNHIINNNGTLDDLWVEVKRAGSFARLK